MDMAAKTAYYNKTYKGLQEQGLSQVVGLLLRKQLKCNRVFNSSTTKVNLEKTQNLQIPMGSTSRAIPEWLFPHRLPTKQRLTASRPDAILAINL